jgi:hypothetical protein
MCVEVDIAREKFSQVLGEVGNCSTSMLLGIARARWPDDTAIRPSLVRGPEMASVDFTEADSSRARTASRCRTDARSRFSQQRPAVVAYAILR